MTAELPGQLTGMVVAVVALAVINFAYKAAGPAILGDREFSPRTQLVLDALPAALLAGLIVVDLLGRYWENVDWTVLPGLGVAVLLRAFRQPHLICIALAVVCTAILRALL